MNNYVKYLYEKIPSDKEFKKSEGKDIIKIIVSNFESSNASYHLQNISEIYRILGEIVAYLSKETEVTVQILSNEIVIIY